MSLNLINYYNLINKILCKPLGRWTAHSLREIHSVANFQKLRKIIELEGKKGTWIILSTKLSKVEIAHTSLLS
jgi:hypothetical protein